MTTKKRKKPPDCSFAFISLFPSAFPSRLSSHSICLLTGPSLEVLNWAVNCFRSAQIVGLFADDKLGQAAMVSSLQHATLTRSAPGHCSWACWAFDYQIYCFSIIMYLVSPRCSSWRIFWMCRSYRSALNFISMLRHAGFLFLALTGVGNFLWSIDVVCYFFLEQHLCVLRPHLQMLDHPYKGGTSIGWSFTLSLPSQYRHLPVLALHYGFTYGKPDLTILALQALALYHCFLFLNTQGSSTTHEQPTFRFQSYWLQHEQVHSIVRHQWQRPVLCSPMFRIAHHLKSIKNKIKSWKTTSGPNHKKQIEKNTEKMHYVENRLIDNADNPRLNH
ncbi:hypothetical protein Cgig2_012664 [Carnegiea gigantea]|uniref:Uncharacterized protein n=1 Tax=Carnegiea gigantea TaxID=171969 RepID=A0A9Q1JZV8_9CARY|nr:hypothetical protein Cgig2_012664 [Carnegiea gigantea]